MVTFKSKTEPWGGTHLKSLFTDAIVEIHLNVPCSSWDLGWPLAGGHGFSVTVRTTEMSGDKALLSPLQETCTKRVEKFHQHQISRAFIWMNAEVQEWLDRDQHLQGKEILNKLQQLYVFLPLSPITRLWFHPSFFKPPYWGLRHKIIFAMCESNMAQFLFLVLLILIFITLIILIFI